MSYSPPENLSAEDKALEVRLVEAYRAVIRGQRKRLEEAVTEQDLLAWRWRMQGFVDEAEGNVERMTPENAR